MKTIRNAVTAAVLMGSGMLSAQAEGLADHFTFSGFGTVGAVYSDNDDAEFGTGRQLGGAAKDVAFDVDSNLGVQLTGIANEWLSATVQGLAVKREKDVINLNVEWAFVKVKPVESLAVRAGRMAMPTFLVSDSRNVGYANTWLRAPNEVYGMDLTTGLDGIDVTWNHSFGGVDVSLSALYSESTVVGFDFDMKNVRGGNLQVGLDWIKFRAGYLTGDAEVTGLGEAPYTFTGFGAIVDRDNYLLQAEYVKRKTDGIFKPVTDASGWYVMGAYRFAALTPYATYASTKPANGSHPINLGYPYLVPLTSDLQKTFAVGLRWDAMDSIAVKFQAERVDTKGTPGVSFSNPAVDWWVIDRATPVAKPVTVLSAAISYVF